MNCLWTPRAQAELRKVVDYLIDNFGVRAALAFIDRVEEKDRWLAENPTMARPEPLLCNRKTLYRSIIVKEYSKLILFTDEKGTHIVDIWDMRRNPDALSNRIRK